MPPMRTAWLIAYCTSGAVVIVSVFFGRTNPTWAQVWGLAAAIVAWFAFGLAGDRKGWMRS